MRTVLGAPSGGRVGREGAAGRRIVLIVIIAGLLAQAISTVIGLAAGRLPELVGGIVVVVVYVFLYRGAPWARWTSVALNVLFGFSALSSAIVIARSAGSGSPQQAGDLAGLIPALGGWASATATRILTIEATCMLLAAALHLACAALLLYPPAIREYFRPPTIENA
jgi:hypothetical protein